MPNAVASKLRKSWLTRMLTTCANNVSELGTCYMFFLNIYILIFWTGYVINKGHISVTWIIFLDFLVGALIPRSVVRSGYRSVCLSTKNYKKITNITKRYKTLKCGVFVPPPLSEGETVKESSAVSRSFLDEVVIFAYFFPSSP